MFGIFGKFNLISALAGSLPKPCSLYKKRVNGKIPISNTQPGYIYYNYIWSGCVTTIFTVFYSISSSYRFGFV